MYVRKSIAALASLALAAQPVLADTEFYFRNVTSSPLSTATAPPNAAPNSEVGTGDLRVYAPTAVRARPGVGFSLPVAVANAVGGVLWSIESGDLPAGLGLGPDGTIAGVPTGPGTGTVVVAARDSAGSTGKSRSIAITVNPVPAVTMASATVGAGQAVALAPQAGGLFGTASWSLAGTLPLGLSVDTRTGAIAGSTVQGGTFDGLVLSVTDADGAVGSSAPFSIAVQAKLAVTNVSARYPIRVGGAFAGVNPSVAGNDHPVAWSMATGSLPDGLALDAGTGAITGMPATAGTYGPLALKAVDPVNGDTVASPSFAIVLAPAPTVGVEASYRTRTRGGIAVVPKATGLLGGGRWFLDNAAAPQGFLFDQASGTLSGGFPMIPPSATANLQLRVIDLFDGAQASSRPFGVEVLDQVGIAYPAIPGGTVGEAYRIPAPLATNVRGTPTWEVSGLPTGTRFDPATGAVSGTPNLPGTFWIRYAVTDSFDGASSLDGGARGIVISGKDTPAALAVPALPTTSTAVTGTFFRLSPAAQGLRGIGTWSASALPAWAGFDSASGTISGTPSAPDATRNIVLSVTDSLTGETASAAPIEIVARNPVTASYPPAIATQQGMDVAASPTVLDAVGVARFAVSGGKLPAGIALDAATGAVSGRSYDAGDANGILVTVADESTSSFAPPFRISVAPVAWQVALPADTSVIAGTTSTVAPTQTGFPLPPRWSLVEGTLPATASLDPATGTITLTNPVAGPIPGLRLQAEDAQGHRARSRSFDIAVIAQRNLSASLPPAVSGLVGTPLSVAATVTGSTPPVTWSVASGSKPAWLSLDGQGVLAGTPTAAGSWSLALKASDDAGRTATTGTLAITVTDPQLTVSGVPATIQAPYKESFASPAIAVAGASGSPSFALASGTLPAGLLIVPATGAVAGSATELGDFPGLSVRVTDANGTAKVSDTFSVTVARPVLTATGPSGTLAATVGQALTTTSPAAKGKVGAVSWSASGLPSWLSMPDPSTGVLRGTPPAEGASGPITLTATDAFDGAAVTAPSFTIAATAPKAPNPDGTPAASVSYPNALYVTRVGSPFASGVPSAGGLGAGIRWSVSPSLPSGLALNGATGEIAGTATAPASSSLTATATDASGKSASASLGITAAPPPRIAAPSLAPRAYAPFSAAATVSGLVGAPVFALSSNAPPWLRLDPASGTLSSDKGGPAGTYPSLVLKVTDADGSTATASFAVTVGPGIAIGNLAASYPGRIGQPLAPIRPAVSGAKGAVTWAWGENVRPPGGIGIDPSTGAVTGTPQSGGPVALRAVDAADGAVATAATSLSLAQPLALTGDPSLTIHEGIAASTRPPGIVGQRGAGMGFALTAGSLPSFARFQPDTGTIELRNPTVGTTAGLAITATDPVDRVSATGQPFSLTIVPSPVVDGIATTYVAQYGKAFSIAAPRLLNAIGAVTWSVEGQLPMWAYQAPDGGIVGSTPPNAFGSTQLTIVGTDSTKVSAASPRFTLSVVSKPEIALSGQVVKGRVGAPISVTATTNGTAAAPVWTYVAEPGSGTLPGGVGFDASRASVGGTSTSTGTASFRFHVEDTAGMASADSQPVQMTVGPDLTLAMSDGPIPAYTTRTIRSFASGKAVPGGLVGAGTYGLSPPAPGGMTAFPTSGEVLTGIPTAPFDRTTFTATLTDAFDGHAASTSFTLAALGPVAVNGTQDLVLRSGAAIGAGAFTPVPLNLTDASKATWSLASGSNPLPTGISVVPSTGKLTGSTTALGSYPGLTISVLDADGTSGGNAIPFAITVAPPLTVTAATTSYGARYGIQRKTDPVVPSGNLATPTYALVTKSGTAPTPAPTVGADGSLTFTPDANTSATWTYAIRATDKDGAVAETATVTVASSATPLVAFSPATVQVYSTSVQTLTPSIANTSGATTITWNAAPASWIQQTPDAGTGSVALKLSNVAAGTYPSTTTTYRLNVKDATNQVGSATLAVRVVPNTFAISSPASNATLTWHSNSTFRYQASATGVSSNAAWSRTNPVNGLQGNGPANLTVAADGSIGLNQASTLGSTATSIYLYDPTTGQYAAQGFNATVIPAMGMTLSSSASTEMEGVAIASITPTITAGTSAGTVSYALSGGPTGVTASATTGVISGTPAAGTGGQTYAMTLTATDAAGGSVSKPFSLTVNLAPALAFAQVAPFVQNGYPGTACTPVALNNPGGGTATGLSFALSSTADFQACSAGIANPCGTSLAPGASCNYGVVLNSGTAGQRNVTLTATPAKGSAASAVLTGNPSLTVSQGSYLLNAGTNKTFSLPAAGLNVRFLLVSGGASGGTTTNVNAVTRGGASGKVLAQTVSNAPLSFTYTIGNGGSMGSGTNSAGGPGSATTVTINGVDITAPGATGTTGGSGSGGPSGSSISGGASNGADGTATTGQGASFPAALATLKFATVSAGGGGGGWANYTCGGSCTQGSGGGGGGVVISGNVSFVAGQGQIAGGAPQGGRGCCNFTGTGGSGYGAGGSGSNSGQAAGGGVSGAIVVEWDAM